MTVNEEITSRDNARLKFVRRVRDGFEEEFVFVEGVRLAEEALSSPLRISEAFISRAVLSDPAKAVRLHDLGTRSINVTIVAEKIFESIADTANPQGVILIAKRPENVSEVSLFANEHKADSMLSLIVFLQHINNPANLGAIVRTAEAAGAKGVIVSKGSADPFSPKALRASMGSAFRVPITTNTHLQTTVKKAHDNKYQIIAADIAGAVSYTEIDWKTPSLMVFGSEADGLTEDDLKLVDKTIRIPLVESVESLNLAVSCGVILFEAKRQIEIDKPA